MRALALVVLLLGCAVDRPVHPMRLEGFPGAPFRLDFGWVQAGATWEFAGTDGKALQLKLVHDGADLRLEGGRRGGAKLRVHDGFLEVSFEGKVVDRLAKQEGKVGDRWKAGDARYTVFGFDRIDVLGEERRALVVVAERGAVRDLYWFAPGIGFARLRTEVSGKGKRDALLTAFEPGGAN